MGAQFSSVSASKCESKNNNACNSPANHKMTLLRHSHSKIFVVNQVKKHLVAFRRSRKYDTTQKQNPDFPVSPKESDLLPPTNTITDRNAATSRNRFDSPRSLQDFEKTSLEHNSENKQIQRTRLKSIYSFTIQRVLSNIQIKNINLLRRPKPNIIIKYGFD